MKSKTRRRVIALVLCMVMLLSCGVTTLAEGNTAEPAVTGETAAQENISAEAQADTAADDAAVVSESQEKMAAAETAETETEETASSDVAVQSETAEETESAQTEESTAADTTEQTAGTESGDAAVQSEEKTTAGNDTAETSEPEISTENETQANTAEKTEKAAQPYSEKYEDDTIKISVSAEAGIVPEGAKLSVTPIEKTEITDDMTAEEKAEAEKINDQYDLTEKKLNEDSEENEETMEGFLAYDISFLVNGEEVEPSGDVNVVMEFREAAIPEGVSEDAEVTVKHLKEDETAEDGVVVEDMADKAEVQTTEKAEVEKVELTADSFSVYTINWSYDMRGNSYTVKFHYVDTNGTEIDGNTGKDELNRWSTTSIDLTSTDYVVTINNYTHQYTTIKTYTNEEKVDKIRLENIGSNWNPKWQLQYHLEGTGDSGSNWKELEANGSGNNRTYDVYFVYEEVSTAITITDAIKSEGLLRATIDAELQAKIDEAKEKGTEIEYVWYKSENGGDFEKVALEKSGDEYNLKEDYYRALDVIIDKADKATETKYQAALEIGGKEEARSTTFEIPYYRKIQNGSFEVPDSDRSQYSNQVISNQWSNEDYKNADGVWQTTGLGKNTGDDSKKGQDIEVLYDGRKPYDPYDGQGTGNNFMYDSSEANKKADDGYQFAEINCETSGALYQDVLTDKNVDLNYYLSHRARSRDYSKGSYNIEVNTDAENKYDTMYLVIMPTEEAEKCESHAALVSKLNTLLDGKEVIHVDPTKNNSNREEAKVLYNADGVLIAKITSNASDWHRITSKDIQAESGVSKTYRPTSALSRFFFISGATFAGGATDVKGNTVGNLIDRIDFGQIPLPPNEGELEITIKKSVEGLTSEQLNELKENLSFVIDSTSNSAPLDGTTVYADPERNAENISVSWEETPNGDGTVSAEMTCVLTGIILSENWNDAYHYTVSESGDAVTGMKLTSELEVTVTGGAKEGNTAILGEQDAATFDFTNTYTADVKTEPVNFFLNLNSEILDTEGNVGNHDNDAFTKSVSGSFTAETGDLGTGHSLNDDLRVVVPKEHDHSSDLPEQGDVHSVIGSDSADNAVVSDAEIRSLGETGYYFADDNHTYRIVDENGEEAFPTDREIFEYIRKYWGNTSDAVNKGNSIKVNGIAIAPEDLTEANFAIRWYVFKDQHGDDYWHIDGILVPKSGILNITKTFSNQAVVDQLKRLGDGENAFSIDVSGKFLGIQGTVKNTLTNGVERVNGDGTVTYSWSIAVYEETYTVQEMNYNLSGKWTYDDTEAKYIDADSRENVLELGDGVSATIETKRSVQDEEIAIQTLEVSNHYVTQLDLQKQSKGTNTPISGAEFQLFKKAEGEWNQVGSTFEIKNNGTPELSELEPRAIYKLIEVNAPAEHVKLEESIYFTVTGNGVELCGEDGVIGDESSDMWQLIDGVLTIKNKVFYELPEAGGSGIYWYMLGGVLLMMAGSLLVYKKRRGEVLRRK